ncbi:diacylglycerol/lipid kinase family protein [Jannaschia formosa]|uniref:diacylglycerol/lipid kinase family protein n=1 Tax=Jannaschia formosa TaxID=2259592 RepID=UPI000E1B9D5F|nr:diacylglycerol kinase family protein [Jannaschia formosa]TFL20169.1 diacylglycerol kinase [Jannaschia formosa]
MSRHPLTMSGEPVSRTPDICIVLNPGSGKGGAARRAEIEAAVERLGGRVVLRETRRKQDPTEVAERAARDGFGTLVAAGGDGTICAVAGVAHRAGKRLGVIPNGTFNFFARSLDLPEEPGAALDLIASGAEREIAIGHVNGRIFLNNASLGLYPAILAEREGTYKRWGRSRLAAHWSVLTTLMRFHRPLSLRVAVDGKEVARRSPLAFVARSAYQLELLGLDGPEDVRAGRFALFLAPDSGRWGLLTMALRLAWGTMKRGRDFEYHSGTAIDIHTKAKRRLVARDGEREKLTSPFEFRMLDTPLRVAAPPSPERAS